MCGSHCVNGLGGMVRGPRYPEGVTYPKISGECDLHTESQVKHIFHTYLRYKGKALRAVNFQPNSDGVPHLSVLLKKHIHI